MTTRSHPAGRPQSTATTELLHAGFWRLLGTTAFDAITMERIALEAGVSRPALYRRYQSVAELTLAALLQAGAEQVPMRQTSNLAADLQLYLTRMVKSLDRTSATGRALRILLAKAQTDDALAASFRDFLTLRREPVRLRLAEVYPQLSAAELERTLDQLFGPILYRLLVRYVAVDRAAIVSCVTSALGALRGAGFTA